MQIIQFIYSFRLIESIFKHLFLSYMGYCCYNACIIAQTWIGYGLLSNMYNMIIRYFASNL